MAGDRPNILADLRAPEAKRLCSGLSGHLGLTKWWFVAIGRQWTQNCSGQFLFLLIIGAKLRGAMASVKLLFVLLIGALALSHRGLMSQIAPQSLISSMICVIYIVLAMEVKQRVTDCPTKSNIIHDLCDLYRLSHGSKTTQNFVGVMSVCVCVWHCHPTTYRWRSPSHACRFRVNPL